MQTNVGIETNVVQSLDQKFWNVYLSNGNLFSVKLKKNMIRGSTQFYYEINTILKVWNDLDH